MPEGSGGEQRPADVIADAFSGKFESDVSMVALYAEFYNFRGVQETLRVTPAMQSELTDDA